MLDMSQAAATGYIHPPRPRNRHKTKRVGKDHVGMRAKRPSLSTLKPRVLAGALASLVAVALLCLAFAQNKAAGFAPSNLTKPVQRLKLLALVGVQV